MFSFIYITAKKRLLTAQKSLVTLPVIDSTATIINLSSLQEESGIKPPPPSRVSSFAKLPDLDILSKLQNYVFEEKVVYSSSDGSSSEEGTVVFEDDYVDQEVFCLKDDDGLILKFDRGVTNYDPDDYGSELILYPDPLYEQGGCGSKLFTTGSWDDFVEINGCD